MVEAFLGLVGGGKSYCSVRRMCAYMASGGRCASNILLSGWDVDANDFAPDSPVLSYLRTLGWQYQNGQYTFVPFDTMVSDSDWFKRVPAGQDRLHRTLLVVDEATDLFDNLDRDKLRSNSTYRELFRFLRLSRHAHVDVLFICQDLSAINSRLRGLVGGIWRSTDMRNFRLGAIKCPFPFDVFLLQQYDRTGRMETRRVWLRKDEAVFALYQSEAFAADTGVKWDGVAVDVQKGRVVKLKKRVPMFYKFLSLLSFAGVVVLALFVNRRPVEAPVSAVSSVSTNVVVGAVAQGGTNAVSRVDVTNALPDKPVVVVDDYCVCNARLDNCLIFGGERYHVGLPCPWGVLVSIDRAASRAVDRQGRVTWLMPRGLPSYIQCDN